MKRVTKISLITVGVIVVVGASITFNYFKDPEHRVQWVVDEVTEELELTEPQQVKLQALRVEVTATQKAAKQKLRDSKSQFHTLFETSTLDQVQAVTLVNSHTQFIDERAPVVIAAFADFYDSLTTQQQNDIREFLRKHGEHHYD